MVVVFRVLCCVVPNLLISIAGSLIATRIERCLRRRATYRKVHKEKSPTKPR